MQDGSTASSRIKWNDEKQGSSHRFMFSLCCSLLTRVLVAFWFATCLTVCLLEKTVNFEGGTLSLFRSYHTD